jgi:hypothetical protein
MTCTDPAERVICKDERAVSCRGSHVLTDVVAAGLKSVSRPPPALHPHAHQHGSKAVTAQRIQRQRASRTGCFSSTAAAGGCCCRRSGVRTAPFV